MDLHSILSSSVPSPGLKRSTWRPPEPPILDGIDEIELDFETDGLQWWDGNLPGGVGIALPDGRTFYLPWAHRCGDGNANLDEATVARWFREQVKHKQITNLNTKFDGHMGREWLKKWGIDFEDDLKNQLADVAHMAALLDDHRKFRFSLEALVDDFIPEESKVKTVDGFTLDPKRMMEYHPGIVAVRAEADVRQVQKLKRLFLPLIEEQELEKVHALERKIIYVVMEMEKNGTKIDVPLLDAWVTRAEKQLKDIKQTINKAIGKRYQQKLFDGGRQEDLINLNSPNDMRYLFEALGLSIVHTATGRASFNAEVLKTIEHPVVKEVIKANKLQSLLTKFLWRYQRSVDRKTGILRYALHQLRSVKDERAGNDDSEASGTISGRFSSTKIDSDEDEGINIQQIIKAAKQRTAWGYEEDDDSHDDEIFVIRRLHIPESGYHLSADAMQVEYRLFAEETGSERLIGIFKENPFASFHKETHKMLLPKKPDLTYRRQKDYNFANIFGAGLIKKSLMLTFITDEQFTELKRLQAKQMKLTYEEYRSAMNSGAHWSKSPLLDPIRDVQRIYDELIPEVKELLEKAQFIALPECSKKCRKDDAMHRKFKHRGYIKTILGRRSRFPNGYRSHKALNGRIQGSGADIMKTKLVELHEARKDTGFLLRFTVHDEVDGDAPTIESAMKVCAILNRQSFKSLRVPILWEVGIGPSWKDTVDLPFEYDGKWSMPPEKRPKLDAYVTIEMARNADQNYEAK